MGLWMSYLLSTWMPLMLLAWLDILLKWKLFPALRL